MSTKYIASNWRLPNQENSSKSDNYGLTFDGSELIDCGSPTLFDDLTSFSFSCWFNSNVKSQDRGILGKWLSGTDRSFALNLETSGNIRFIVRSGGVGAQSYINTSDWSTGNWYNVIGTYDGSNVKLYLDGVLKDTVALTGTVDNATQSFRIGVYGSASYFDGSISEVSIFDYSLSSTQVSTLYGSSSLGAGNPMAIKRQPVGYWPLGDNSASNPLTQPNEAVEDASVFDFDGSGYIESSYTGNVTTLSLWFKPDSTITTSTSVQCLVGFQDGGNYAGIYLGSYSGSISNELITIKTTASSNASYYSQLGGTISDTWHNLVIVGTGTQYNIYLDNVNVFSGNLGGDVALINSSRLDIGTRILGGSISAPFNGEISNIAIWNSDQTTEISNIYNSGVPATTYTNTPTAWYKLDQSANWDVSGSGNWTIPDASGNGNDGTSSGMTSANLVLSDLTRAVPYDSYSFNFDSASSDYIDCGTGLSLLGGACTFSAWCYMDDATSFRILHKGFTTTREYAFGTGTADKLFFILYNQSTAAIGQTSTSTITAYEGEWIHLAATYDGSGNNTGIQLYINGVAIAQTAYSLGSYTSPAALGGDVYIGRYNLEYADGKISNASIFNQELTSTEVMKLYANGVPQDLSSFSQAPIAWWPLGSNSFWNGSAWTVRDMSTGGSNDGTGQNIGIDGLVGDSPRSSANGVGTNNSIPENLVGTTKWSDNNSWSINMSSEARVTDVP